MMSKYTWNTLFAFIAILLLPLVHGHPQCLDFYPPFKSKEKLDFCTDNVAYGCCGNKRDNRLHEEYLSYQHGLNASTFQECKDFLKGITCAECHPYAAHVYDAENPFVFEQFGIKKRNEVFPGLCKRYCEKIFETCRDAIILKARSQKFTDFVSKATTEAFCSWAALSDIDYCFPKINKKRKAEPRFITDSKDIVTLCLQDFQHNLRNPLVSVHANDGSHRLFLGEQRGIVYVVLADGRRLQRPFLNITDRILNSGSSWDERGFLGLVFHPNYKFNGRFFVYYSYAGKHSGDDEDGNREYWWSWKIGHKIRISEFLVSRDPYVADPSSERVLLEVEQPEANHEGGMLLFGDDGYLYIFVGDGGGAGDDHGKYGNSLNMSTLLGKVLRINVDVYDGRPYVIPSDNPFVSKPGARPEIFAYGIRNIWRCSKDRGEKEGKKNKGRILCGDVGQNAHEEVDIIVKGGNYGWRAKEGFSCYDPKLCNSQFLENEVLPIIAYGHNVGKSIVGGYIYRGCKYPNMEGYYFYGDTVTGRLFAAKENEITKEWDTKEIVLGNSTYCNNGMHKNLASSILSFGEDEAGEIYILSTSFPDPQIPVGKVYKLVDPLIREDPAKCKSNIRPPRRLSALVPRKVNKKPTVVVEESSKENGMRPPCFDKLGMCLYFQGKPRNCNVIKKFTMQYCPKACNFC